MSESELVTTGGLGRRPTPLHIDETRMALLGAEMGIDEARIVATNLLGTVTESAVIQYEDARDAASCLKVVAKGLVRLARRIVKKGCKPLGLGVGLHGGVNEALGVLHFAPHLGWRNVDAAAQLRRHFQDSVLEGLPLFVQNEADVAALAEFEFANQHGADPLIYLSIGHGVGAGVIVNDRLLTGYRGFAGEVGHTILQAGGPRCSCGRRGCADALIGLGALLGDGSNTASPQRLAVLDAFFVRVETGEAQACAAVHAAGANLGMLLNNLWVAFDPMRIVLGGPATRFGQVLLAPAMKILAEYSEAAQLPAPSIQASRYGVNAVAVGGAALVRYHLTRPFNAQASAAPATR